MKVKIENCKASAIFLDNKFYDTKKEIDISFSEAVRIARDFDVVFVDNYRQNYNPENWKKDKYFGFTAPLDMTSGWGNVSYNLLKNSKDNHTIAYVGKPVEVHDAWLGKLKKERVREDGVMIWHEQPRSQWLNSPFQKNIAILPFETTLIPGSWVSKINSFDLLITPCEQNIKMFRDSGVKIPIELVRWGVTDGKFKKAERNNTTFTFGTHGALSIRKGTDLLVEAFKRAFTKGENVKLICKTSNSHYHFMAKDPRIEEIVGPVTHEELMDQYFSKIDVGVYPATGEGFGLGALECLSTGAPAIVTGWGGQMEYYDPKCCLKLKYDMVPAEDFTKSVYKEQCGDWAKPQIDDLVEKLRWCYEHQEEVKKMGEYGYEYVQKEWLWSKKIKEFHKVLNQYL
jgi:glycosyltransferase involved in cell wall biosynthesis